MFPLILGTMYLHEGGLQVALLVVAERTTTNERALKQTLRETILI
jgi:hypothetical protein